MAKKPTPYVYGESPNPTNWHEAANAIKSNAKPRRTAKKPSLFMDKMTALEQLIKDSREKK